MIWCHFKHLKHEVIQECQSILNLSLIYSLTISYMYIHWSTPNSPSHSTHTHNTLPSHLWGLSILGAAGDEAHWVQLMLPVGIVRDNTGLTVGRTYTGNHSYSELVNTIVMSCPDDSISKHYSHPLVLTWKKYNEGMLPLFFLNVSWAMEIVL